MSIVSVQINNAELERSLLYVACSRAKTLNGLFLIGQFKAPKAPTASHPPSLEMQRLRDKGMLIPKFHHLYQIPLDVGIQIVSHNVQSLKAHLSIILNDPVFRESHLLLLQETWAKPIENFEILTKIEISRSEVSNNVQGTGSIIFSNANLNIFEGPKYNFHIKNVHISTCIYQNLLIVNLYRSPRATIRVFKDCLQKISQFTSAINIICCGDFNENISENSSFVNYMKNQCNLDLLSPIKTTTDAGTTIDAVFGRLINFKVEVFVYESCFSHHKPLIIRILNQN